MFPALRQPKCVSPLTTEISSVPLTNNLRRNVFVDHYVILTLKDENKLVLFSDAYHGILKLEDMFKCVFCAYEMKLNDNIKELHKNSTIHKKIMESCPYIEEFCNNLVRKLDRDNAYCTICNVVVISPFLSRHITSDVHIGELGKATARASDYKPCAN